MTTLEKLKLLWDVITITITIGMASRILWLCFKLGWGLLDRMKELLLSLRKDNQEQ